MRDRLAACVFWRRFFSNRAASQDQYRRRRALVIGITLLLLGFVPLAPEIRPLGATSHTVLSIASPRVRGNAPK